MWTTIVHLKVDGDIRFKFFQCIQNQQTVKMFNISVNFEDTKKIGHTLKSSSDFYSYFDAFMSFIN